MVNGDNSRERLQAVAIVSRPVFMGRASGTVDELTHTLAERTFGIAMHGVIHGVLP